MNLRRAELNDVPLLTELRLAMRAERENGPAPEDMKAFADGMAEYFRSSIADNSYIGVLLYLDGQIAGTGGVCLHRHPPAYNLPSGKFGCLLNIYTLPEFRHRGVAAEIVRELMRIAKAEGCEKATLNASAAGKPLYLKLGFTEVQNEMEQPL